MGLMTITLCKNTFNKIFKNLASELDTEINHAYLGICYKTTGAVYEAYKTGKKIKDIEIDDYVGAIIDFSGGTEIIKATINQAGNNYAKELNCNPDSVKVIMQYNNGALPNAVLMKDNLKVRNINIEKEFLNI